MKRGKMHVKSKEKLTFLFLRDDSIWRAALSESPISSLKFEHLSQTKEQNDALIGARYIVLP